MGRGKEGTRPGGENGGEGGASRKTLNNYGRIQGSHDEAVVGSFFPFRVKPSQCRFAFLDGSP